MKFCSACKKDFPLSSFYKGSGSQGRQPQCKACRIDYARWALMKTRYGVSKEQYLAMNEAQGGVCAVCGEPETRRAAENLGVDHNHETGAVRGLLCFRCNSALGLLRDDIEMVRSLCLYLVRHEDVPEYVENRRAVDEGIRFNRSHPEEG